MSYLHISTSENELKIHRLCKTVQFDESLTFNWNSIDFSTFISNYKLHIGSICKNIQKISTFDIFQKDEWNHKERDWLYQRKYFGRRQVLILCLLLCQLQQWSIQFNSIEMKKRIPPLRKLNFQHQEVLVLSPLLLLHLCSWGHHGACTKVKEYHQGLKWEKGIKTFLLRTTSSTIALSPSLTKISPQSQNYIDLHCKTFQVAWLHFPKEWGKGIGRTPLLE